MTHLSGCARTLLLMLMLVGVSGAEIAEVRWGFDGKVRPEHFNPLALLFHNPGPAPFGGALELGEGPLSRPGAAWRTGCYLAPGTSRWVFFHPWIGTQPESFQVRWLPGGGTSDIDAPTFGAPATVMLVESGRLAGPATGLRSFSDELFPSTVLAMDGLACVVLDHAPRWQPAQRQALRDWVARGGTLYLLPAVDGRWAHFTQELAFLEQVDTRQVVGAGVVLRHAGERSEFTPATLVARGFTTPVLHDDSGYVRPLTSGLFQLLTGLVRPHHPWTLIFLVLVAYLLLIGPGAWFAARRGLDYRVLNLALGMLIIGCATVMWVVGKRGYGERASLSSLAYAHALGEGAFALTQWSSVFVTSSGRYELSHPGGDNLFACPNDNDRVDAVIASDGTATRLDAVIPLYSSQPFIHGGRLTLAGLDPAIIRLTDDGHGLQALDLRLAGVDADGLAWGPRVKEARALYAGKLYTLHRDDERFTVTGSGMSWEDFLTQVKSSREVYDPDFEVDPLDEATGSTTRTAVLARRFTQLIAYGLGGQGVQRQWNDERRDPGQVVLFLLVDLAPSYVVAGGIIQEGTTVFRFDLAVPSTTAPAPVRNAP